MDQIKSHFGAHTSSRNSEVIHAGIYYPHNSLKAKLCIEGRSLLYQYCQDHKISHFKLGKFIVATKSEESLKLESIRNNAARNGVDDLDFFSARKLKSSYPMLNFEAALWSPSTGIVDSHGLMLSLVGDIESTGSNVAFCAKVDGVYLESNQINISMSDGTKLSTSRLINASGLWAAKVANMLTPDNPYAIQLVKGHYVSYSGNHPFKHLIYPVPVKYGLGTHLTIDLAGQLKLGPDTESVEDIDYSVKDSQSIVNRMHGQVAKYWPQIKKDRCQISYCGIRPKAVLNGQMVNDFVIDHRTDSNLDIINLFGIESPGLTSCLSIAQYVKRLIA